MFWQGKSDINFGANYEPLFRGMLRRWRAHADRDYPLVFIQLPTYTDGGPTNGKARRAGLRDAQRRVAVSEAHTEMMVSYDIYGKGHPPRRKQVWQRLAQTVPGMVYNGLYPG